MPARQGLAIGGENGIRHRLRRKSLAHPCLQTRRGGALAREVPQAETDRARERCRIAGRNQIRGIGPENFRDATDLGGDERNARRRSRDQRS